jgi:hypothetical protein
MSKRRVSRRTVVDGVRGATRQLEKAIGQAVRCADVTRDELLALRLNWRGMDGLIERLTRKGKRR